MQPAELLGAIRVASGQRIDHRVVMVDDIIVIAIIDIAIRQCGPVHFDLLTDFAGAWSLWQTLADKVKGWIDE